MSQESYAAKIISDAEALLAKVNGELKETDEFYRSMGIDPAKVLPACEPAMGPKERQELAKMMEEDQAAVQREVDEGAARARFSTPSAPTAARKPRPMI